jgi:hypothetical protein
MRRSLVGALTVAGLVLAAMAGRGFSEPPSSERGEYAPYESPSARELITHMSAPEGQPHVLTVIDPRQRVIAVYHVDRASGEIALRSVRNFTWDMQMIEFNSGEPLPQDIRAAGSSAAGHVRRDPVVSNR